jgi:hypothetical protein
VFSHVEEAYLLPSVACGYVCIARTGVCIPDQSEICTRPLKTCCTYISIPRRRHRDRYAVNRVGKFDMAETELNRIRQDVSRETMVRCMKYIVFTYHIVNLDQDSDRHGIEPMQRRVMENLCVRIAWTI